MYRYLVGIGLVIAGLYLNSERINTSSSSPSELSDGLKGSYQVSIVNYINDVCTIKVTQGDDKGKYIETYGSTDICMDNKHKEGIASITKSGQYFTLLSFKPIEWSEDNKTDSSSKVIEEYKDIEEVVWGKYRMYADKEGYFLLGKVVARSGLQLLRLDTTEDNYIPLTNIGYRNYKWVLTKPNMCAFGDTYYRVFSVKKCPSDYSISKYAPKPL